MAVTYDKAYKLLALQERKFQIQKRKSLLIEVL